MTCRMIIDFDGLMIVVDVNNFFGIESFTDRLEESPISEAATLHKFFDRELHTRTLQHA